MTRLAILFVAGSVGLTSCAPTTTTPTTPTITTQLQQVASDASLIATGLSAGLATIATTPGVDQNAVKNLTKDLAVINAGAQTIETAASAATPPSGATVQSISTAVADIATGVLPLIPGAAPYTPLVAAAQVLLPELLASAGVAGAAPTTAPTMTVAEARLRLQAAAKKT
jgi:hypothetical protein